MTLTELLNEAIMRQNFQNADAGRYKHLLKAFMLDLDLQNFSININLDNSIASWLFIGKWYGLSKDDKYFAMLEEFRNEKDFQERRSISNKLEATYFPKLRRFLKNSLSGFIKENYGKPIIDDEKKIIAYGTGSKKEGYPYIKFSYSGDKLRLISLHDNELTLKKKNYNDKTSYKLGSKKAKEFIKKDQANSVIKYD